MKQMPRLPFFLKIAMLILLCQKTRICLPISVTRYLYVYRLLTSSKPACSCSKFGITLGSQTSVVIICGVGVGKWIKSKQSFALIYLGVKNFLILPKDGHREGGYMA
jgi:hypothetical protein